MNDSRERFEAWAKDAPVYGRDMSPGAWDAWQAAERAALERAAQVCDETETFYEDSPYHAGGAMECAIRIRALIEQSAKEPKD